MKAKGWILSGVLHAAIVIAVILGLPDFFNSDSDSSTYVTDIAIVELDAEEIFTKEPEPESVPEPEPVPEPERQKVFEDNTRLTPKPKPRPKPEFDALLENLAAEEVDQKPTLGPLETKLSEKNDDFDDLLSSFANEKETIEPKNKNIVSSVRSFGKKEVSAFTSIIQSQVEDNWVKTLGAGHGGTIIEVRVTFKPNGEIIKIIPAREYSREYTNDEGKLIIKATDNNDVIMANLNDNVKAALSAASPVKGLDKFIEFYDKWKNISFKFKIPD